MSKIIFLGVLALSLAACEPDDSPQKTGIIGPVQDGYINGVRCITWRQIYAGGISCDWQNHTKIINKDTPHGS